jgi:ligand-binding sensor domain-containing protein
MTRSTFFLFVFFSLACCIATAQEKTIVLKHITPSEGLSDNQVTCMLRDKLGFMWIGTKDGLNRYDGREFYVFKHDPADSSSLCGNSIKCLELDGDSLLWIGTSNKGFCSYDYKTGRFKSYNKNNLDLNSERINDLTYDKYKNQIWIAQNHNGLQVFNLKNKIIDRNKKLISDNTYYDVEMKDSVPYFAGIIESLKRVENIGKFRTPVGKIAQTINKILISKNGSIWCGAWDNGLHEFDTNTKRLNTYFFDGTDSLKQSGDEIISLVEDENNTLWCGTKTSGIHFFDLETKTFIEKVKFSIPVISRINNLYRDDVNRIWIATETGLFVYDPLQNQFDVVSLPIPPHIASCKVNGRVISQGGKEFVITTCGLFYKDQSSTEYVFKEITYRNENQELYSIFSDADKKIYIGTNRTVFLLDTVTLELNTLPSSKKTLSHGFYFIGGSRVNSIVRIKHNNVSLIAASLYGHCVSLFDPERKNIYYLLRDTTLTGTFLDNLSRKLFMDSKNNFWICGASNGITKVLIPEKIRFNNYPFEDTLVRVLYVDNRDWGNAVSGVLKRVNNVYDIIENTDGSYWLTTQGDGLVKFFPASDTLPFISYANNLKSLQGMTRDQAGNLWIISSTGLLHYATSSGIYKLYDKKSGIPESLSGYFFQDGTENISAGFDGGFITFNPKNILSDAEKPRVFISRLWVMDAEADSLLLSPVKLNHNNNFLKFYISANCFSNSDQVTYMYWLEGIDSDWRNNQNNPLITYTNLPHGNFNLKVKAVNSSGIESEVIFLPVEIIPPFYKRWYFYLIVAAITVSLVFALYKIRINHVLKVQEVRNKIARDLHDDIGSTLGSIHLYSQIANKKLNGEKPEDVKSILEKIESSSSEIIDKTGDAVWAVKASNDTLKNLILRMESYAASLLGAAGIQFNIEYDERIAGMKLEMTERKNIFLIFKEATHNIVKYAGCTEVNIVIKKSADKLVISISDNGKGSIANGMNPYNGNGIKNMKSRAEEMKGNFQITSQEGKGTTINLEI